MTTTVSIGRNIGDKPMSQSSWSLYQSMVRGAIDEHVDGDVVFAGEGYGRWEDEGGEQADEQAFTWVVTGEPHISTYGAWLDHLADAANVMGQEAIAVTEGRTLFVGPERRTR